MSKPGLSPAPLAAWPQLRRGRVARGDKVAATARSTEHLTELVAAYGDAVLRLELDVTDRAQVFETVKRADEHFARLDLIVKNAPRYDSLRGRRTDP
ncbi:SDR family NAD(P)-dependent oxidoreductase [Nocardia sp. CA-084685]|uniref:SDR family NAD(P)-dependent oxidoreductase n=1 Tax=Nocardia sp. CA-084685 TaxID=3239970 RepID=UPI003D954609